MFTRRTRLDPDWKQTVESWKATQNALRQRMVVQPLSPLPRFIAGADAAFSADKTTVFAAAVVYDRIEKTIVDIQHAQRPADVPYVPGFLGFREGPAVLAAIESLRHPFGVISFDGQGYAHPRRCGLATHLGVTLDVPSIGVAKSRLIGTHGEPGEAAGQSTPLMDSIEQIGLVLRTRAATKPVYVSIGHRVDLTTAAQLVLACCTRYRIPQPTRIADIEVGRQKRLCASPR
jgi:deoxyribonuclease V